MEITTIKDKRIKALAEDITLTAVKGFNAVQVRKVSMMLAAIRVMIDPVQLTLVPGWRAHELKGDRKGTWSLSVTGNERLTFFVDIEAQTASLLDYEDYH